MSATFSLPQADDMLSRLTKVSDDGWFLCNLYPHMVVGAGQRVIAMGLIVMLEQAIVTSTINPRQVPWNLRTDLLDEWMPKFIAALSPSEATTNEAQALWKNIQASRE